MTLKWLKIVNTHLNYLILLILLIIFWINAVKNERVVLIEKKHPKVTKHFM